LKINNINTAYSYLLLNNELIADSIELANNLKVGNHTLFYSDDMDINEYIGDDKHLIALGYMVDIRNGQLTTNDILRKLSNTEDVDRALDYINGRYVLLFKTSVSFMVFSDASALLPINYDDRKHIISSHDILIKEILENNNEKVEPVIKALRGSFDFTRFEGIFKFNPSLKLDLKTKEFTRYYPETIIERRSIGDITKELEIYFEQMNIWLKNYDNNIILTLTAGFDSRVSMALTRELSEKVEYITYEHQNIDKLSERAKEIYEIDMYVTKTIAENFNVNHTEVDLADFNLGTSEKEHALEILQSTHSFPLIDYFRNERKFYKALHIKSTVYGMGKSDFPLIKNHMPQTIDEMKEFIHGVSKDAKAMDSYSNVVNDYLKRNLQGENVGKGRHYFEIFHLESRMGNWHSNVTQETDPELLDFIYVNSRRIIDLLQSPSIQERRDKVLYKNLILKYWPALLFIGFNENNFAIDIKKHNLNGEYVNGLKVHEINNLSVDTSSTNSITLKPSTENVGPQYHYSTKLKNNTHKIKKLKINSLFNKENARGYIDVKIMNLGEKSYSKFDIVDLSKEKVISLKPFEELIIIIEYNNTFEKASWIQAGRIVIENI